MTEHTRDPDVPPPVAGTPTGWLPSAGRWEHDTLRRATVHGVRLFNSGAYHESHDCFEDEWYNYGAGTTESRFCHGMVQVAAGAHKLIDYESEVGMDRLFETAATYLRGLPADFYGVDLAAVRSKLREARAHPVSLRDWQIPLDGRRPVATDADYSYVDSLE